MRLGWKIRRMLLRSIGHDGPISRTGGPDLKTGCLPSLHRGKMKERFLDGLSVSRNSFRKRREDEMKAAVEAEYRRGHRPLGTFNGG